MHSGIYRRRRLISYLLLAFLIGILISGCNNPASKKISTTKNTDITGEGTDTPQFKFIVCGDPQNNYEVFRRILEAAKSVDFMIIVGDLTGSGTPLEFENFNRVMKESGIRYYAIPGNHDVATMPVSEGFAKYIGPPRESFDYKNAHFLLIDNSTPTLGFYPEERKWVSSDLKKAKKRGFDHIFAFAHVPPHYPYSAKADKAQIAGMDANDFLVPVLKAGGVDELFCGHVHIYDKTVEDGLTITITGGAGAPHMESFGSKSFFHYVIVELKGKKYSEKVIRL